jgi:hypothetical protein
MFDIPKALVERALATLANADNLMAEYQRLATALRAELAEIKKLRQAVQAALGKAE